MTIRKIPKRRRREESFDDAVKTSSVSREDTGPVNVENVSVDESLDARTRWYLTVNTGESRIRALYDPGASGTVTGDIAAQIATAVTMRYIKFRVE